MTSDLPKYLRPGYSTNLGKKVKLNILQHSFDMEISLQLALVLYWHHLHPDIFKSVARCIFSRGTKVCWQSS